MVTRCPGSDQSQWKPEDIHYVACWNCGVEVEIWKDEPMRRCPQCRRPVRNPNLQEGCEKWCPAAGECPGVALKPAAETEETEPGQP